MDPLLRVKTIACTPNPQSVVYAAMHQDYSDGYVADESPKDEAKAGEIIVKRLLKGEPHFGPLEHPQITFAVGYCPHSVMQQARTHRVGTSFDCQSFRYTGDNIVQAAQGQKDIEEVIYFRPIGQYTDRSGKRYFYSEEMRNEDKEIALSLCGHYAHRIEHEGLSNEHARGMLPFDYRQHFVVSFNARSLMHFLDLRAKTDAQLEIRWLCELMFPLFKEWMPAVAGWYEANRLGKGRLAP